MKAGMVKLSSAAKNDIQLFTKKELLLFAAAP